MGAAKIAWTTKGATQTELDTHINTDGYSAHTFLANSIPLGVLEEDVATQAELDAHLPIHDEPPPPPPPVKDKSKEILLVLILALFCGLGIQE